ncbi:N-acetyltransferase [Pseudomonas sp. PCH446]
MALGGSPVVVASRDDRVVGVLFSAAKDMHPPTVDQGHAESMAGHTRCLRVRPCLYRQHGKGPGPSASALRATSAALPGREAILFIRRDNSASLRAHERLGMREVAGFTLEGDEYAVLSDRPAAQVSQ